MLGPWQDLQCLLHPTGCLHLWLTLANRSVYKEGVLREAFSVASILSHLHETIRTLKTVVIVLIEACLASWMTPNTDIVDGVVEKTHTLAVGNTEVA